MKKSYLRLGGVLYIVGGLIACGGEGCSCSEAGTPSALQPPSKTLKKASSEPIEASKRPPPPIDEYKEEPIAVEDEFLRYTTDLHACHKRGEGCAREAKAGRKMARRALRELRRGNKDRLHALWKLTTDRLGDEPSDKLRVELTNVLKIAFIGADPFKERLLELLENESQETVSRNIGELLAGTLGEKDEDLMGRLEHYLRRTDAKNKGLVSGQIGVWGAMKGLFKQDPRWLKLALECLEKTPSGALKTVLSRIMSHALPEHRVQTSEKLGQILKRSRSATDLSLASASVETLGKLGQANALDDIEHAIKTRFHQRSFLPSAALALFHLAGSGGPNLDGKRVIASAQRILEIPGLSLVAYRYALYAIRDSGHASASEALKSYAKHPHKEARKIAVKALLGVGKRSP